MTRASSCSHQARTRGRYHAVALCFAWLCIGCGSSKAARGNVEQSTQPPQACLDSLKAALAADTTSLRQRRVEALTGASLGGVTVIEYRDNLMRRQLYASYYGETGAVRYRFHFASGRSFVVRVTEDEYAGPLTRVRPTVLRRFEQLYYVCSGTAAPTVDGSRVADAGRVLTEADSLLGGR